MYTQSRRYYSSSSNDDSNSAPVPIFTINNLSNNSAKLFKDRLKNKAGIYSFVNTINGKQYIGSAKDLYLRLNEHLSNKKSNSALQDAFNKYELDKFNFCIYEYFTYKSKIISNKALTDMESDYISKFKFNTLYNFKAIATSMLGYKHTEEARKKMVEFFKDKNNHPMFGKNHTKEALALISKPGELNPVSRKRHCEETKTRISKKMSKHSSGVGLYDLDENLILKFNNNVELAKHLNISRVTVGKYLNKGLIYDGKYRFKVIQA